MGRKWGREGKKGRKGRGRKGKGKGRVSGG